jgi:hypothetical protein
MEKPANPGQRWEAHAELASLYKDSGNLARAEREFQAAVRILENTRSELLSSQHRLTFLSHLTRFYQSLVDLRMERGDTDAALLAAESSRARILAERLGTDHKDDPARSISEYVAASKRLNSYVLCFWLAPRRSFAWLVAPNGIHAFSLPGESEIGALVDAYQGSIRSSTDPVSSLATASRSGGLARTGASDIKAGPQLYSLLLAGAQALVPPGARITIVPDGALLNLNFETLPVLGSRPHYWIEEAVVSVAPSIRMALTTPAQPGANGPVLAIGDAEQASPDYPRLTSAAAELASVQRCFPQTTVLRGISANVEDYLAARPRRYSIIHFAAHGIANRSSPLDSAIVLSSKNGSYLLYAREVAEQPLTASVVTLASCRSAGAKSYPGEGLVGLTWAFLRAGARNVIATLWDVSDVSTAELMSSLYGNLAAGTIPAIALREAKLSLLHGGRYSDPYHWGAFQIYLGPGVH